LLLLSTARLQKVGRSVALEQGETLGLVRGWGITVSKRAIEPCGLEPMPGGYNGWGTSGGIAVAWLATTRHPRGLFTYTCNTRIWLESGLPL
jgi:hypothetical protein